MQHICNTASTSDRSFPTLQLTPLFHTDDDAIMDVKSAGRTLDLFETFAQRRIPLGMSELARSIGAPVASCFYLVRALEMRGYLYTFDGSRQFYPTRRLLDMARSIADLPKHSSSAMSTAIRR